MAHAETNGATPWVYGPEGVAFQPAPSLRQEIEAWLATCEANGTFDAIPLEE